MGGDMGAEGKQSDLDAEMRILRAAVNDANEAFITIDQDSRILVFNRAAERMFGYSRDEVVGGNLDRLLMPGCREGHRLAVARYVATGEKNMLGRETEFVISHRDGRRFPVVISFSETTYADRHFFTGIMRDLSETRKLQEQVVQSERLAALGQVVAEINHEIKNPLMLIGGVARRLLKKSGNEEDRSRLQVIAGEVERLEGLLAELNDLYRPHQLNAETFDLNVFLAEVAAMVDPICQGSGVRVKLSDCGAPFMITADREKLKQVLINLLKNSIEAMPAGGNLYLAANPDEDGVEITVRDTGHGIPEDVRDKVCTPFFTTKKDGTGLGLAISKRIVEEGHGGTLNITGHQEGGTLVTLRLRRLPDGTA